MNFFIQHLFEPESRFYYLAWILVVTISIVLHELAHGWMAIRRGDDTPIRLGRMTGNPLVHMGPFSLAVLALLGIAWGQMPIDPGRLRGRYAEAAVAAAGPGMNLFLAVVSLVSLGLILRFVGADVLGAQWMQNLTEVLWIAGVANLVLMLFNLMPVPPLDGSHILANFHRGYAQFIGDPEKQGMFFLGFAGAFLLTGAVLWPWAGDLADTVVRLVMTVGA